MYCSQYESQSPASRTVPERHLLIAEEIESKTEVDREQSHADEISSWEAKP